MSAASFFSARAARQSFSTTVSDEGTLSHLSTGTLAFLALNLPFRGSFSSAAPRESHEEIRLVDTSRLKTQKRLRCPQWGDQAKYLRKFISPAGVNVTTRDRGSRRAQRFS
jgi:hypothetical protein